MAASIKRVRGVVSTANGWTGRRTALSGRMRGSLQRHTESPASPVHRIEVDVLRAADTLTVWFVAEGDIGRLSIPVPAEGRADELWRTTCFEVFVRAGGEDSYLELNLSPSGQWQAYAFESCRVGRRELALEEPEVRAAIAPDRLSLASSIDLSDALAPGQPWSLGLSAVVEDGAGARSYWALSHPPGAPDFHHASVHTLSLPPEESR